MTQDSFDPLIEARAGMYSDGHPPIMAALWRVVDTILAGPLGMLVLQVTIFELGLYLLFRRTFGRRGAAIAASGLLVFPPVMLPMAVIWKDCFMAGFLTLGFGALLSSRRSVRIGALGSLMLATAFRYNAFAATMPLVILCFEWRPSLHWIRRYAIALGAWLAITFMAFGVNAALTDHQMHYSHSLAVFDIVGTLAHVDPITDAELERTLAGTDILVHKNIQAKIRAVYSPRDWLPIVVDKRRALWNLPFSGHTPAPKDQRDAIARCSRNEPPCVEPTARAGSRP
ncbi:MAG: hypothetical protein JWP01_3628 [Myxococcales bacterium]|nr:hypothetical protein [Myxococcales bacterium]